MRVGRLIAAAALAVCAALGAASAAHAQYATGLVPATPAEYRSFPKVKRHRGFHKRVVDLSDRFPPPGNQGRQFSCAAWATAYAARSLLLYPELGGRTPTDLAELPSPQYVYSRVVGDNADCTTPMAIRTAMELLETEGVVTWSDYPYDPQTCRRAPPASLKAKAARLRIGGWRAIERSRPGDDTSPLELDDIKNQLSVGLPVVFGMNVGTRFQKWKPSMGPWKDDQPDPQAGGHGMTVVGYDEDKLTFKVMNSWSANWGDRGYITIDEPTFRRAVNEAYVVIPQGGRAAPPPAAPPPPPAPPPAAPPVEARLQRVLAGVDCARLSLDTRGPRRAVTGFGGLSPALEAARAEALRLDPALEWRVVEHPWPQCDAEIILAEVLPDTRVRLALSDPAGRPLAPNDVKLRKGQEFSVALETNADRPYVHVIYIQADGSAVELYRGTPAADAAGRRRALVGADGPRGMRFQVDAPLGDESLIAVAAARPLFGDELKTQAFTERQFLTLLNTRVVESRRAQRPVSAALVRLRTS